MIRLFTSHYQEPDPARRGELTECLRRNLQCEMIDEVCLLLEATDQPAIQHEKLRTRRIEARPTFGEFFTWANERQPEASDLSVIANSDIYFDAGIAALAAGLNGHRCAALARWDVASSGRAVLRDRSDSQDAWVFRGPIAPIDADFCVGVPRCDNRILHELRRAGYEVINPAFSVRAYHLHAGVRGEYPAENEGHFVDPPYAYLWPHNLAGLAGTTVHNLKHSDCPLRWRFDRRKAARWLPVRAAVKTFRILRSL